ncbi:hypothetical protein EYZ11_003848 [Aspergillus tanneri]|uniref:Uncharacterized protein n=1 Tax=Aspergillus tanneri TaxID=1220188 RepID=A0A4S3JMG2_9EURO|nr:hypothetical protein EYZ11_003848 [Aspergillus tanneri]
MDPKDAGNPGDYLGMSNRWESSIFDTAESTAGGKYNTDPPLESTPTFLVDSSPHKLEISEE